MFYYEKITICYLPSMWSCHLASAAGPLPPKCGAGPLPPKCGAGPLPPKCGAGPLPPSKAAHLASAVGPLPPSSLDGSCVTATAVPESTDLLAAARNFESELLTWLEGMSKKVYTQLQALNTEYTYRDSALIMDYAFCRFGLSKTVDQTMENLRPLLSEKTKVDSFLETFYQTFEIMEAKLIQPNPSREPLPAKVAMYWMTLRHIHANPVQLMQERVSSILSQLKRQRYVSRGPTGMITCTRYVEFILHDLGFDKCTFQEKVTLRHIQLLLQDIVYRDAGDQGQNSWIDLRQIVAQLKNVFQSYNATQLVAGVTSPAAAPEQISMESLLNEFMVQYDEIGIDEVSFKQCLIEAVLDALPDQPLSNRLEVATSIANEIFEHALFRWVELDALKKEVSKVCGSFSVPVQVVDQIIDSLRKAKATERQALIENIYYNTYTSRMRSDSAQPFATKILDTFYNIRHLRLRNPHILEGAVFAPLAQVLPSPDLFARLVSDKVEHLSDNKKWNMEVLREAISRSLPRDAQHLGERIYVQTRMNLEKHLDQDLSVAQLLHVIDSVSQETKLDSNIIRNQCFKRIQKKRLASLQSRTDTKIQEKLTKRLQAIPMERIKIKGVPNPNK